MPRGQLRRRRTCNTTVRTGVVSDVRSCEDEQAPVGAPSKSTIGKTRAWDNPITAAAEFEARLKALKRAHFVFVQKITS